MLKFSALRKAFFKWLNNNFCLSLPQTTEQWWKKDNGTKLIPLWYPKDNSCLIKFRCNKLNCSSCTKISSWNSNGIGAKQLSHLQKAVIFRKKRELRLWYCPMTKYRGKNKPFCLFLYNCRAVKFSEDERTGLSEIFPERRILVLWI